MGSGETGGAQKAASPTISARLCLVTENVKDAECIVADITSKLNNGADSGLTEPVRDYVSGWEGDLDRLNDRLTGVIASLRAINTRLA